MNNLLNAKITEKKLVNESDIANFGVSPKKIKPFDAHLVPTMTNLGNGKLSLKFNDSVLVQKGSSSLYSNFILYLYVVYDIDTWPHKLTNNFTLKIVYLVQSN